MLLYLRKSSLASNVRTSRVRPNFVLLINFIASLFINIINRGKQLILLEYCAVLLGKSHRRHGISCVMSASFLPKMPAFVSINGNFGGRFSLFMNILRSYARTLKKCNTYCTFDFYMFVTSDGDWAMTPKKGLKPGDFGFYGRIKWMLFTPKCGTMGRIQTQPGWFDDIDACTAATLVWILFEIDGEHELQWRAKMILAWKFGRWTSIQPVLVVLNTFFVCAGAQFHFSTSFIHVTCCLRVIYRHFLTYPARLWYQNS